MAAGPVYAYGHPGRAGLGNMLFPWARAEVFRQVHKVPMLATQWTQPKIGPLLRGEKDLRYYVGLFDNAGQIGGLRKFLILRRAEKVAQKDAEAFMAAGGSKTKKPTVVVFSGWEGWFE